MRVKVDSIAASMIQIAGIGGGAMPSASLIVGRVALCALALAVSSGLAACAQDNATAREDVRRAEAALRQNDPDTAIGLCTEAIRNDP